LWVYHGGGTRRHGKPEVRTAATLVLAIEILECVFYSGTQIEIREYLP
jgi:hypothetical protein